MAARVIQREPNLLKLKTTAKVCFKSKADFTLYDHPERQAAT
jgi:hypothetical protein